MSVMTRRFGVLSTGEEILIYRLQNAQGAYADVTSYGAILVSLCVPDREGVKRDVVLGFDDLAEYEKNPCFFGSTIGRNGNRIEAGRFKISGKEVVLNQNENGNNLHSGPDGFEKKVWKAVDFSEENNSITLCRISPSGENGFPGEFCVSVQYELTDDNTLKINYSGYSDEDTVANLTNHSYFNLNGEGSGSILSQYLELRAAYYTPVADACSIPTGVYAPVKGTPMDFLVGKPIGQDIDAEFDQLAFTSGYDHNYVTDDYSEGTIRAIARAWSEESGITMEVATDCPCVQFYAGNFIVRQNGKNGHIYNARDGFCLETQVEPNAVNVESFHSPILKAGEKYNSTTCYRFSVK